MQTRKTDEEVCTLNPLIPNHLLAAGMSAFGFYPFRMFQSLAPNHVSYASLYQEALPKTLRLEGINVHLLRCAGVLSLQSSAKNWAEQAVTENKALSMMAGLAAVSLTGTVWATFVETWFIRKIAKPGFASALCAYPRLRITSALVANYFSREVGHAMPVFFQDDMSFGVWVTLLSLSAVTTSINTKIIYSESTFDMVAGVPDQVKKCLPNYRQEGWMKSLSQVAKGGVYTHPAYQAYYKNPCVSKQLANLLFVYCSYPVLTYRSLYLLASALIWKEANAIAPKVNERIGLFANQWRGDNEKKPLQLDATPVIPSRRSVS